MKVCILLAYYERPNMVRFALKSLRDQPYKNWELVFVDDSSKLEGEPIVREMLPDDLDKVRFYNTNDPNKKANESMFAKFWNEGLLAGDADIALMLCDDDALYLDHLTDLVKWYEENPDKQYSYGHVIPFNPFETKSLAGMKDNTNWWLNKTGDINPVCQVDASQVSWRTCLFREDGIRFPFPKTKNLDEALYKQLVEFCGPCPFNGLIVQYKAIHNEQLGTRNDHYNTRDIPHRPT